MKRLFQKLQIKIRDLSQHHLYISLGILVIALVGTIFIAQLRSESIVSAERKAKQEIQKKFDKNNDHFESVAAKHSRKQSKGVEDPKYSLGHCDPKEAPRDMDMKKSTESWSPC